MAQVGSSEDTEAPVIRRERAAIAAQACQTCRTRKSKCDEQRPKCGLCQRLSLDCQYREPVPTKKDKTMTHILDALSRLESKVDNLSHAPRTISTIQDEPPSIANLPRSIAPGSTRLEQLSAAHRVFVWPSIYLHLVQSNIPAVADLQFIVQKGTSWLVEREYKHTKPLAMTPALPAVSINRSPSSNVSFSWLSIQQIQSYTEAYFHTFNVVYPILDQETFTNDIVPPLLRDGYGYGDIKSVLALLVYALGQVALRGTLDPPISAEESCRSGFRGGTITHPPGLEIFNEALKRIGLTTSDFSIESIQCHLLQAMYYGANAMHLEFWRAITAASTVCQILLRTTSYDWDSPDTEVVKRVFWTCHISESLCRFDLNLPGTNLPSLQHTVPLPWQQQRDTTGQITYTSTEQPSQHCNFRAVLSLEKLISDINLTILEPSVEQSRTANGFNGPPMPLIREMARQLDSWRVLLPRQLQWLDSEMFDFPYTENGGRQPMERLFAPDQGAVPIRHRYNLDIATAHLRTRFYFARYLMYQPFVYKVLHFPELLTKDDADCAAAAIRAACMWPVTMAPPRDKKRLVPFLFTWTQTFISVLLILEMTRVNSTLRSICEDRIDPEHVQTTVALMLDWLRDVKQFDGIASWSWTILQPLFQA